MRFVNALGLGEEPPIEPVRRRLARSPGVRFKLDADAAWAPALVNEVAATGAVDTIDFKGQYGFEVDDPQALGALLSRHTRCRQTTAPRMLSVRAAPTRPDQFTARQPRRPPCRASGSS